MWPHADGWQDGDGTTALINSAAGIVASQTLGTIYFADFYNHVIRAVYIYGPPPPPPPS